VRRILTVFETMHKPSQIIQQMLEHPEKSDELLDHFLTLYKQRHEAHEGMTEKEGAYQKFNTIRNAETTITSIPRELILEIGLFLQPHELNEFMNLVPSWSSILKKCRYKVEDYYRKICRVLFTGLEPTLPTECMFVNIRTYVRDHPLEFSPNIRNYVEANVREYVWQIKPFDLRLPSNHFRSLGSFENVYNLCPRVHFNGYYVMREKYVRPVEHGLNMCVQKYYVVYYYRYIRFMRDGSVLYTFSNLKLTDGELADKLSMQRLKDESDTIKGEYMQHKEKILIKIARSNTIFSFECLIQTQEALFDNLLISKFNLEVVDENYIVQDIYKDKHKENRYFSYTRLNELARENSLEVQSASH